MISSGGAPDAPEIHPLVASAFAALDAEGCKWALLRGLDGLANPASDVDLLVGAESPGAVEAALARAGFVRMPALGHGSHAFYLGYDPERDSWIELDCVSEVAFGAHQELGTGLAPALLERRHRRGAVSLLAPADAFWHGVLHHLLGRGEVPARHQAALRALAPEAGAESPLSAVLERVRAGSSSEIAAAVAAGDWAGMAVVGREIRRRWRRRAGLRSVRRQVVNRAARHLPAGSRERRGLSLAILGPDGAGKTTLAEGLRETVPLPARYVYLGIWRQARLEEHLRHVVGARLAIRLAKLLAKSVSIAYHRRRGRLVLLDRFTCDADLPSADLDLKGRISAKMVQRTCAEPDVIVLLDAPVELMYARKGEHGTEELQLRRTAYLGMAERFPQMVVVDAAQPLEEVRRQATALLWRRWTDAPAGGPGTAGTRR